MFSFKPKSAPFVIEEYLDSLPEDTTEIDISNNNFTYIPGSIFRFKKLEKLNCQNNRLVINQFYVDETHRHIGNGLMSSGYYPRLYLPVLPDSLKELNCANQKNSGTRLIVEDYYDYLPKNLEIFNCSNCGLYKLPSFPQSNSLKVLNFTNNRISRFLTTILPKLIELHCSNNRLTLLNAINLPSLQILNCLNNEIEVLANLPESLTHLVVSNNRLAYLPTVLPPSLTVLICSYNNGLTQIPKLPDKLFMLQVSQKRWYKTNVLTICVQKSDNKIVYKTISKMRVPLLAFKFTLNFEEDIVTDLNGGNLRIEKNVWKQINAMNGDISQIVALNDF